jgi:hypothetical protein
MSSCAQISKCRVVFFEFLIGVLTIFYGVGCSKSTTGTMQDPEAAHLNKVGDLAEEFKKAKNGKAPADLNELKTWAIDNGKAKDDDFSSTRDKEPYVFRRMGNEVVIAEKTGKDGRKFITAPPGQAQLMSEMGYNMMLNKGAPTGPPTKDK